jgi:glycerophosphoryl diester phosphodiesterase
MTHPIQIASHRGGAFLWPENSVLAFRQALALPVEQLELDVHLTADGRAVVLHDATLDRTTDGEGAVRDRTLDELRGVRLKGTGGESIPTLDEAAALVRDAGKILRLEIKADAQGRPYPGLVTACVRALDRMGMRGRTVLMSFQPLTVEEGASEGGFAGRVLLLEAKPWRGMGVRAAIALGRSCGAEELGLPIGEWGASSVAAVRDAGMGAGAWGANHEPTLRHGMGLGLDVITTDDPVLALALRG